MATIREISDRAGVSIATVSKVLNNKSGVKQETADRILQIADQLNYRPNLNARSLKLGDARTIGIITEDLTVFNTPEIVDGVASVCETLNYHYILSNLRFNKRYHDNPWDYPESNVLVRSAVNDLLSKQVAGIIYIGCHSHLVASLKAHAHIPFVCVYCTCEDQDVPCVGYDDRLAAYEATGTLLEHTSEHIGMITGPIHSVHTLRRANGFLQALHDHGVAYDSSLVRASDWDRDSGYRLGGELIRAGAKAIFAQNDLVGTGVIDWCNQNGIAVGRDIFLIGYDNRLPPVTLHRRPAAVPDGPERGPHPAGHALRQASGAEGHHAGMYNHQTRIHRRLIHESSHPTAEGLHHLPHRSPRVRLIHRASRPRCLYRHL